ncbi:MAG: hypothetical protein ACPG5B_06015 [Chitinophagales bacterium]
MKNLRVALSIFFLSNIQLNAQNACDIYNILLDTLKTNTFNSIEFPGGFQLTPYNLHQLDSFPEKEVTYHYKFFIDNETLELDKDDLEHWLFQLIGINSKVKEYETMSANLERCVFENEIVYEFWKENSSLFKANLDKTHENGITFHEVKFFLSNILYTDKNAFVYARCIYPNSTARGVYHCFWLEKDKYSNWLLKKKINDVR